MTAFSFAPVRASDQARVIATIVSAFIEDPVEHWLFPEPLQYLTQFPTFVAAFAGEAFTQQTAWTLASSLPSPYGSRRASKQTQIRSLPFSATASPPANTRTCSLY